MGLSSEKPINDISNKNHYRIPIKGESIDFTRSLLEITHPIIGNVAILSWVGKDSENNIVRQPAIWLFPFYEEDKNFHLSYEGFSVYIPEGLHGLGKDNIAMPKDGSIFKMQKGQAHYFNNEDCLTPNCDYRLDKNNTSIVLNNISIYDENYAKGCMINLRASFDGVLRNEQVEGNITILCTIDTIG